MFDLQRWRDAVDARRLQRGHDAATGKLRMYLVSGGSASATATDPRDFGRNVRSLRTGQRDTRLVLQSDATRTWHAYSGSASHRLRSDATYSRYVQPEQQRSIIRRPDSKAAMGSAAIVIADVGFGIS